MIFAKPVADTIEDDALFVNVVLYVCARSDTWDAAAPLRSRRKTGLRYIAPTEPATLPSCIDPSTRNDN